MIDLATLYETYAPDLHRFALFLSGDAAAADDLVSETFVRLWGARERLDLATVRGYLFTILRHLFLEERRRARPAETIDDRLLSREADPERRAAAKGELAATLRALQELPESDRTALLLRVEGDLPYSEIAAALGMSAAAARVKVHRARARLAAARRAPAFDPLEKEVLS
ncbi:MAG: sigma-70 family RNA polymerase sigma factor [Thermoanaerobaculia bacterium]|nr:MAG: sigma-70 family RNA polymerase sigma factor [Thermoanaerobaculia bacterium]